MPGLYDLAVRLRAYADGTLTRAALLAWCAPVFGGDPLDVDESDDTPWADAPDEERLFWRLLHLIDGTDDAAADAPLQALADRVLRCLASTASPADTLELLPLLADQDRFCTIVGRTRAGLVSRTGFLSVVANARYAPHARLWLQHAGPDALDRLRAALADGEYAAVARMLERAPDALPDPVGDPSSDRAAG